MKKKISYKKLIIPLLLILLTVTALWIAFSNKTVEVNHITVTSHKLPSAFDGYKIAHVSDLHNANFGKDNQKLISLLKDADPNMIAITGDMLDSRDAGYENDITFAKKAAKIAPCYFIPGNHEAVSDEYLDLKNALFHAGVTVIEDKKTAVKINGEKIILYGICDPLIKTGRFSGDSKTVTEKRLKSFFVDTMDFNVLLAHRPEHFELYAKYGFDVVLSGHAHGGQFRLPFIGGVYAPNQGLFPKYDSGLYTQDGTNMIVSRGLGKSIIPFRINNRPEIIIVELKTNNNTEQIKG